MKKLFLAGGVAASVLFVANASYAGPSPPPPSPCSNDNLSLTIDSTTYNPASCATGVPQNNGPAAEATNLNAALGTTGFVYLAKGNSDGTTDSSTGIGGITFDVSVTPGKTGTWTVSWTDTNGTAPLNLPLTMDFEVGLFGGDNGDGYLFDDVLLTDGPYSGTGSFTITFLNKGGQIPDISHLTLTGGNASEVVDTPEPLSIALLGTGLLGLGLIRRRSA